MIYGLAVNLDFKGVFMYPRDFCYWLQGAIELGGLDEKSFADKVKVDMIENHLNMVAVMNDKGSVLSELTTAQIFCMYLKGLIALRGAFSVAFADVKDRLHNVFEHEIDPSFPADKAKQLDAAHNPVNTQNNHHNTESSQIRC